MGFLAWVLVMRPIIFPYNFGSQSARALSEELRRRGHRAKRVRRDGNYRPYQNHLIINWGSGSAPSWDVATPTNLINHYESVNRAGNKLLAFEDMEAGDVSIPEFTSEREVAEQWQGEGHTIACRGALRGHSGVGITICTNNQSLAQVPLYVKYVKKKAEFRVHVFRGQVIDVQKKRRRSDIDRDEVDFQVRNHSNGWVFCRNNVAPDQSVLDNAIDAVDLLGLDFGAVDVIWNAHHEQAYVLEVNTAPGLEGTTLTTYANAIEEML